MRAKNEETKLRIYEFINEYIKANRVRPTIREIAESVNCAVSTAYKFLGRLQDEGLIDMAGRGRITSSVNNFEMDYAPILGLVACGKPQPAIEDQLSYKVTDTKYTVDKTELAKIKKGLGIESEIKIDGNLDDWKESAKTYYYGAEATDKSGKGFKFYAFKGQTAIYIGCEIRHKTLVSNDPTWWLNLNIEPVLSDKLQRFASLNGKSKNVREFAFGKSVLSNGLYTTQVELAIPYISTKFDGLSNFVSGAFACRPGSEEGAGLGGDLQWWSGPINAYTVKAYTFDITPSGIVYKND